MTSSFKLHCLGLSVLILLQSADSAVGGSMAPGSGVDKAVRKAMEAVAKHMRYKIPTKSAVIKGQKVEYFSG